MSVPGTKIGNQRHLYGTFTSTNDNYLFKLHNDAAN